MSHRNVNALQEYLNESAEYSGMGLLLIGLFIEIFIMLIEVPNDVVNTVGVEQYLYSGSAGLILISLTINMGFIMDYLKTYFKKQHGEARIIRLQRRVPQRRAS